MDFAGNKKQLSQYLGISYPHTLTITGPKGTIKTETRKTPTGGTIKVLVIPQEVLKHYTERSEYKKYKQSRKKKKK